MDFLNTGMSEGSIMSQKEYKIFRMSRSGFHFTLALGPVISHRTSLFESSFPNHVNGNPTENFEIQFPVFSSAEKTEFLWKGPDLMLKHQASSSAEVCDWVSAWWLPGDRRWLGKIRLASFSELDR